MGLQGTLRAPTGEWLVLGEEQMYRCEQQEEHPYLLTLAKALNGKKEGRNGENGKGWWRDPLDPLAWGRQKNI